MEFSATNPKLALRGLVPPHATVMCAEALAAVPKLGLLPECGEPPWSCADGCAQALSIRQALHRRGNKSRAGKPIKPTGKMVSHSEDSLSLR